MKPHQAMNLTLVVTTMLTRKVYHFSRGDLALRALNEWDNHPFTVDVQLTNRVPDPEGEPVARETPFGPQRASPLKEILVWRSTDTLPRWATVSAKLRLRAEAQARAMENQHHAVQ